MRRNRLLALFGDTCILSGAYCLAHLFRLRFGEVSWSFAESTLSLLIVVAMQLLCLWAAGTRRIPWRYITAQDTVRFAGAMFMAALTAAVLRYCFPSNPWIPFSYAIVALDMLLATGLLVGVRLAVRLLDEGTLWVRNPSIVKRVLLVGAVSADHPVLRELRRQRDVSVQVVGLIDHEPRNQHAMIQGVCVLGKIDSIGKWIRRLRVNEVVVADGQSQEDLRRIMQQCEATHTPVRVIPSVPDLISGRTRVERLRDVDICDLLGRAENPLDGEEVADFFRGKCIWVTGAGGSIGSELVRQIVAFAPAEIVLVERSESALYEIHKEVHTQNPALSVWAFLADVGDADRMGSLLVKHPPAIILHAAAYKHVPLVEHNPGEAVTNNLLATRRLAELAVDKGVDVFLLVSTDKAINPVSVMGMTKRLAEISIRDLQGRGQTRFCAVRFGNVLGSSGSVIPLFKEQIAAGGPVTVTHPDMRRYFMTDREAARLILQTAVLALGGEIFVLDMGEPVKIVDMAEEMIRLSGFKPYEDIRITFVGMRPGEKLFEELDIGEAEKTRHPQIYIGKIAQRPPGDVAGMLAAAAMLKSEPDARRVIDALQQWL